jgi:hypothetical protein
VPLPLPLTSPPAFAEPPCTRPGCRWRCRWRARAAPASWSCTSKTSLPWGCAVPRLPAHPAQAAVAGRSRRLQPGPGLPNRRCCPPGRCAALSAVAAPLAALAPQAKAGRALPLAIMTSDDTHARTLDLLERHAYWGAAPGQVTLIKQEKVACLAGARLLAGVGGCDVPYGGGRGPALGTALVQAVCGVREGGKCAIGLRLLLLLRRQRCPPGVGGEGGWGGGADQAARPRRRPHAAALHRWDVCVRVCVWGGGGLAAAPCDGVRAGDVEWLQRPPTPSSSPAAAPPCRRPGRQVAVRGLPLGLLLPGHQRRRLPRTARSHRCSAAPFAHPCCQGACCRVLAAAAAISAGMQRAHTPLLMLAPGPPPARPPPPPPCRRVGCPRLRRQLAGGAAQGQGGHRRHHAPHLPRRAVRSRSPLPPAWRALFLLPGHTLVHRHGRRT